MKKILLTIVLAGLCKGAFATSQTMDADMMIKMMQFMHNHPEVASQMMRVAKQETDEYTTSPISTVQSIVTKVNAEGLLSEYSDKGSNVRELDLEGYDFSDPENLSKVIQFFRKNRLINLKIIDLSGSKNVGALFEKVFNAECTTSLYSLEWIKASRSTGLTTDHVSKNLFNYIGSYQNCQRDMRMWSSRHGDIVAAFIRIDVDGIDAFKESSLWKGIKTKEIEVSYRSEEASDMAPVIIRTEG